MTFDEFNNQLARLRGVYGDKAYPNERVRILWAQVGDSDAAMFSKAVDRWIGENKFAPMLQEFRDFYYVWKREHIQLIMAEKRAEISSGRACDYCGDEGQLIAQRYDDESIWAFLCTFCEAYKMRNMEFYMDDGKQMRRSKWGEHYSHTHSLRQITGMKYKSIDDAARRDGHE